MSEHRTFASVAWQQKGTVTRRERLLAARDPVIPWRRVLAVIAPHDPTAGQGRHPLGLEKMLRISFVQQWFNVSDPAAEDALSDSESIQMFVGVELGDDVVPDETTILRFRLWTPRSSRRPARRSMRPGPGIPRCTRPARGSSGTSV